MNLVLSVYLQQLTKSGNGCVWYAMNLILDMIFGTLISYILFKLVDWFADKNNIEVLKSGMYVDEKVELLNQDGTKKDPPVNYKIWFIQLTVWCMIVFLSKLIVFFFAVAHHKPILAVGVEMLSCFKGQPKLELITIMVIFPVTFNSVQLWIQDAFLKGDKHIDTRIQK